MKHMHLFALIAAILVSACGGGGIPVPGVPSAPGTENNSGGSASGTATHQYFTKTAVDYAWLSEYVTTTTLPSQAATTTVGASRSIITASTSGVVTLNGNTQQQIDANGAWISTGGGMTSIVLPATLSEGTTWVSSPATGTAPLNVYSAKNSTIAAVNVTKITHAGAFTDCLQRDTTYTYTTSGGVTYSVSQTNYYSPTAGGTVYSVRTDSGSDGSTKTVTTQLVAAGSAAGMGTPTITNVDWTTYALGTDITITGTNFSPTPAENYVVFAGKRAIVSAATATSLTVTAPSIPARGDEVYVYTLAGSAYFIAATPPVIYQFRPIAGAAGTPVTITGTDLGSDTNVTFNGVAATVTSATATQLVVTVPPSATSGPITLTTANRGTTVSWDNFTVDGVNLTLGYNMGLIPGLTYFNTTTSTNPTTTGVSWTSLNGDGVYLNYVSTASEDYLSVEPSFRLFSSQSNSYTTYYLVAGWWDWTNWGPTFPYCHVSGTNALGMQLCSDWGITIDRMAGTVSFASTPVSDGNTNSRISGSLTFPSF